MRDLDPQVLSATLAAIDAANATDTNLFDGQPLAQIQGIAASKWLGQLVAEPSLELQLAARAHHLRRWEVVRADYPQGRAGYLRWRRDNKAHQADALGSIMQAHQASASSIERAQTLLTRTKLRTDVETQALEDAACLVFLETQFEPMLERLDRDHLINVVAKTLNKMSASAVALAGSIALSAPAQGVVAAAVAANSATPKTVT